MAGAEALQEGRAKALQEGRAKALQWEKLQNINQFCSVYLINNSMTEDPDRIEQYIPVIPEFRGFPYFVTV